MRDDHLSLQVYWIVRGKYEELSLEYGRVGNIIGLFMHDLMIHFSSILIHRNAVEDYGDEFEFPFVNKSYALSPFRLNNINLRARKLGPLKKRVLEAEILPFAIGNSIPYGYGINGIRSKLIAALACVHLRTDVYLPSLKNQIDYLYDTVECLCREFQIPNVSIVQENWAKYVALNVTSTQKVIPQKGILLGTRCDIHNRKLATNYLQQEKTVIGFTHGEISNTVVDEPILGYSDLSYCTHLVDYGGVESYGDFNAPLIPYQYRFSRSSSVISKLYKPLAPLKRKGRTKVLYIPTLNSGNYIYGPFRQFEDKKYNQWQLVLLKMLKTRFFDVTVKVHPKNILTSEFSINVEQRRLEQCVNYYDLLVLDYYSTAATIAISTEKPILYFDLGLRNLKEEFSELLKKRCFFQCIDPFDNASEQLSSAIDQYAQSDQVYENSITESYSLSQQNDWLLFGKLIHKVLL